ncbi:MAG: terminase [Candidatus Accumulibacter sp.]|nr:terminase [Accumulibacter sp.]
MTTTIVPTDIIKTLSDPEWRLNNLYRIMVKGGDGDNDLVVDFAPNRAQQQLLDSLHGRDLILKARQLGFTTLSAVVWLDTALFVANMRCGIIAQDQGAAEVIFRDKVRFGYEHIGERLGNTPSGESWNMVLKRAMPLSRDSASELLFAHNNSSIRVATSMRSGTIHRLHVSEYGKICAKYPDKAREVVTGSIPAVPLDGVVIIESTAEGQDGDFYKKVQRAMAAKEEGRELSRKDFKLHFFPWWDEPGYSLHNREIAHVVLTERDQKYFRDLETKIGRELSPGQKAWYVATRESDFSGEDEKMWQEYPGTPEEAFQVSTEGVYYAEQLAVARKGGRVCRVPYVEVPVNTFWDVGRSDSTAIWFHQQIGQEHRFIRYYETSGETLGHYVQYLRDTGYIFGKYYLPHDAAHKRLSDQNKSIEEMLADLGIPATDIIIVDRILDEQVGIMQTRKAFPLCWFDTEGCADGLKRLGGFKRAWNKTTGAWRDSPAENGCEHGADAFRQFGQALDTGQYMGATGNAGSQQIRRRGSAMAV